MSTPRTLTRAGRRLAAALLAAVATVAVMTLSASPAVAATTVRIVTLNVNFGDSAAQIKSDINAVMPQADVITLQEVKNVDVRSLIPNDAWAVKQDTSSSARAGSAVMVRRAVTSGIGGLSLTQAGNAADCGDGAVQARFIARVDVTLLSGAVLKVASLHLPPLYCPAAVYNEMADNVVSLSNGTPGNLVLGADWNKDVKSDPNNIQGRTGLNPRAPQNSIDGFFVQPGGIGGGDATNLAKGYSDHNPVQITVSVA